jgi:hypothetical protein
MFNNRSKVIQGIDSEGYPIINITEDKAWFASNVMFVFGKGAIYDEDDDRLFSHILAAFTNEYHGKGFLINQVLVEDYKDSAFLQKLEQDLFIANGNYHICLIPYVMDGADITKAPEIMFKKLGAVNKFMQWDTIEKFISRCLAAYALITDPKHNPKSEPHAEPERFNFDTKLDNEAVEKHVNEHMSRASERAKLNPAREDLGCTYNTGRSKNKMNLWNQMRADLTAGATVPTTQTSLETRFNLDHMQNLSKEREYRIYDDYDERIGKNTVVPGASMSSCMPKFNMKKVQLPKDMGFAACV